jgi:nitric oxide reductase activation protein
MLSKSQARLFFVGPDACSRTGSRGCGARRRQALREADRVGVHTHVLVVDAVARDYLLPMFGPGNWDVLTHPEQLPEVLTTVYGRRTGA